MPQRYLVLVDESGDPKRNSGSKEFTMTASITTYPLALERITDSKPRGTRYPTKPEFKKELKYFSSNDRIRREVLEEIMATNPAVYAARINKNEAKSGSPREIYHLVTRELIGCVMADPALRRPGAEIDVVYDRHRLLDKADAEKLTRSAAKQKGAGIIKTIDCNESVNDRHLQAHDFLAGAVGSRYNHKLNHDFRIIESAVTIWNVPIKKRR